MNKVFIIMAIVAALAIFMSGCGDEQTVPKPRGYFQIELPEHRYTEVDLRDCPFSFEIPVHAEVVGDKKFFDEQPEHPCWMDIRYPQLGGRIYFSYKQINSKNTLDRLIEDTYKLTFKHAIKAEYIDETPIRTSKGVGGMYYEVGGDAASSTQFFVTDSVNHFLRGALYFETSPNFDSLQPVINFIRADIMHMMNTLEWERQ